MSSSRRPRHRDALPASKELDLTSATSSDRRFRITQDQRELIAGCLRAIDDAIIAIERQQNPDNRRTLRDLSASADHIFEIVNGLEEID